MSNQTVQQMQERHLRRIMAALRDGAVIQKAGSGGWMLITKIGTSESLSNRLVSALDDKLERVDDRTTRVGTILQLKQTA